MRRRYAREKALQILFQIDVGKNDIEEAIIHAFSQEDNLSQETSFIRKLVEGTRVHLVEVDDVIEKYSVGWELSRMANVDRNILRVAVYELLFEQEDVPAGVVVNEAVELAKLFGTIQSGKFVNGVLGKVVTDTDRLRKMSQGNVGADA